MNHAAAEPVVLDTTGTRLYEQVDELRAGGPAVRVELPEGLIAWSVTRGDVARKLLMHPDISKDARKSWPGYQPFAIPWLVAWVDVVSMFTTDGADQKRLRNLVSKAFTPRRIEAMRPAVENIVDDLLEAMSATAPGAAVDLRKTFSYPIPTRVICDLFGVPDGQRAGMLEVIDAILSMSAPGADPDAINTAMFAAMNELIAYKREQPGDDLTSLLLSAQEDGDRLSEEELVSTLILMIGAGSETAVALINHAVLELSRHPEQLSIAVEKDRWDDVIEEVLREHSPIMNLPLRYTNNDIDLGDGVILRKGDLVLIGFGGHGRDPEANPDPDRFDIDRADRDHLAFGHGIHYCLGAPLARLEAKVALPALFARFPHLRLAQPADELRRQPSFIGNDYQEVPVVLTPSETPAQPRGWIRRLLAALTPRTKQR